MTSILWVGVIPMTLALIIGYVFAREGQWGATQQNQSTAARKTSEGIWLALHGRLRMASRFAADAEIAAVLQEAPGPGGPRRARLAERLKREAAATGELASSFHLYDRLGDWVLGTEPADDDDLHHPEWVESITTPRFISFNFDDEKRRYAMRIVAPVHETGATIGFLSETQGVRDLLSFALGDIPREEDEADRNSYAVVYVARDQALAVYLDEKVDSDTPEVRYEALDARLHERLQRNPDKEADSFFLWRYSSRDVTRPVLMAYHQLRSDGQLYLPDSRFYFVVYRPVSSVFANINLGWIITFLVSLLVIGIFCIIGYRIVNNSIIRPVSLLNEGAQIIRQGDLELKLRIDTGGEIEELASSFNEMALALRHNMRQLGDSEEKYRSLITSMRDGIYQADPDGVITFINPAGVAIFGYERQEQVLGLPLRALFIEEIDYARVTSELAKERFIEHTRVWIKKPDNQAICVELSANSIFDDEERFVGVEGTFRDVTQNVRLEQEARERSERISAINQITKAINSSLEAGGVYESIVVEMRRLVNFDYAAVALQSEEEDASSGNDARGSFETRQIWPEPVDASDRQEGEEPIRLDGEASCAAWVAREHRNLVVHNLREKDSPFSRQFPDDITSCACIPLYANDRIIGTLNLGAREAAGFSPHDVEVLEQMAPHVAVAIVNSRLLDNLQESLEEVTLAREKLHEVNEELKTLDEMKTNLLSNVSHELRTPLVAVMGYTDMILDGKVGPVNEVQAEYLGISLRNVDKLVTLIENLLDFSRLHRGAEQMVFDTFDLVQCARTSLQIVQPVADSRGIVLSIVTPTLTQDGKEIEAPILVEGDKGKLGQVFNNLLSNAVKFNHKGGQVTVTMRENDGCAEVVVSDTGIGIPEEALDKIFTRFYQYDGSSTRKYGGTGIGLAIAQDIMRLHGSHITVTSTVGKGSTFRFALPSSGARAKGTGADASKQPMPTETHLLVELVTQDRALSSQIRSLLLSEGMDLIHAAYPTVAVSLANKYNPDCILVDSEAGPLASVVLDEILSETGWDKEGTATIPICLLTNDDALYQRYRKRVAGRIRRDFRKSGILSGIHYVLSKGVAAGQQLGDRILCVDDDAEIVRFMVRCLTSAGYQADECATGEEAIECVRSGRYWLVLLDIAMPGMDGWETCRCMKSEARQAGLKVCMVTAKPLATSGPGGGGMEGLRQWGADGYCPKPFKAEDLISLVQGFAAYRCNGAAEAQEQEEGGARECVPTEDRGNGENALARGAAGEGAPADGRQGES